MTKNVYDRYTVTELEELHAVAMTQLAHETDRARTAPPSRAIGRLTATCRAIERALARKDLAAAAAIARKAVSQ
jgi:hypothetical protein